MSSAFGPLADRPRNPVVGVEIPHESAALHVTGTALYTDDLLARTPAVLHAWPVQAPHAHRAGPSRAGRGAGAPGGRRAGRERLGRETG